MRILTTFALLLVVVCATFGEAASIDGHALSQKQETEGVDLFANTKKLIEELVGNLQKAAQHAANAMSTFAAGLKDQVKLARDKAEAEIGKLKDRVKQAIKKITDRFSNAGEGVKECIESHQRKADALFNEAIYKTMTCADEKVQEVGDLISKQVEISKGGLEFANNAMEEMRNCTENTNNMLTKGACLARVALRTEMKGAVFLTQSGISIARTDIALASLPVSLDICAGRPLLDTGMGTVRIIRDLGGCSASTITENIQAAASNILSTDNLPAKVNEITNQLTFK